MRPPDRMFDTVGKRSADPRHRAVPLFLSLVTNGSIVAVLFASARQIEEVVAEVPSPIVYFAGAPPEEPSAPPAAEAPRAQRAATTKATAPVAVESAAAPAEVAPPESSLDQGGGGGTETTNLGGGAGGVDGGAGSGTGGIRSVHFSQVAVKYRSKPKMPEAARVLGFDEESCNVRFFIDEKGKPYDIRLEECPTVFRDSALEAAWQWRFYPMKDEGMPIKAQFVLSIKYRLQ